MIVTAFIKHPVRVTGHEEVPGIISDPVLVYRINSQGAHLAEDLPEGQVIIYDLVTYETETRTRNIVTGYEEVELPIENPEEGEPEVRVITTPILEEEEYEVVTETVTTYAATASES